VTPGEQHDDFDDTSGVGHLCAPLSFTRESEIIANRIYFWVFGQEATEIFGRIVLILARGENREVYHRDSRWVLACCPDLLHPLAEKIRELLLDICHPPKLEKNKGDNLNE
jgi:hypothetical protein